MLTKSSSSPCASMHRSRRAAQRGMSLVFSLITLVALSLAAVALIRSVDTGSTILGNLSFKQDTLLAADDASRQAIEWLANNSGNTMLHANVEAQGYSASLITELDPTGARPTDASRVVVDWERNDCSNYPANSYAICFKPLDSALTLANGVTARWVIVRVCGTAGDPAVATVSCARPVDTGSAATGIVGGLGYPGPRARIAPLAQYFRVIVRTRGGRNTSSTTETLVHF